jgi:hypothetical protein
MGVAEEMESPQCVTCTHKNEFDYLCSAYPFGIPGEILQNRVLHNVILEDQMGDAIYTEV